ncbi:MAG: DUF4885 domain-containing protein [bacterium]|nr:DUF4885 domain-containing protein [bacterium]
MAEIGYYNYYNNTHRMTVDKPKDWYQQMVDRYNSDELKAKDEGSNPYSEINLSIRALDEKLADWASSVRSKCKNEAEVRQYLSQKYWGVDGIGYTKKFDDPETYAMYENDYNAICFGTVGSANRNDPRLNNPNQTLESYEAGQTKAKHDSISLNMENLLKNNGIELSANDNLLLSFNPYNFGVNVSGSDNTELLSKLTDLLSGTKNSQNLMHYAMNLDSTINGDSLAKFRAYQEVKKYTGLDLSQLTLKDGEYYTSDGKALVELLKDGIENSSVGLEFKGTAYNYAKELVDRVAQKGWNSIDDLKISIAYNKNDGFYTLNNTWEV